MDPITIVIPAHNREAQIMRTLQSVQEQTYRPLRVILVDNASTDATHSLMQDWAQQVQASDFTVEVIHESTPGASAARNAGLRHVQTPWTLFFDSDDTMQPDHVARAMECVDKHPKAQIVGWDVVVHDSQGRVRTKPFASIDMIYNAVLHGTMATQRYMARTDLFRKVGGWNQGLPVWNDIELATRLLTSSPTPQIYKINGSPRVDVYYTADSITGTGWSLNVSGRLLSVEAIEADLGPSQRWIANLKRGQLARVCRKESRPDMAAVALSAITGSWLSRRFTSLARFLPTDLLRPLF